MRFAIGVMFLAACGAGVVDGSEDSYWDETRDDDGDRNAALAGNKRVVVEAGSTNDAELVEELPVARSESGATKRVVMRTQAPQLAKGDRLIAPTEVQVTTRCDVGQTAPGCNYNPSVRAQLRLGNRVIATQTQSCTKAEHHCMFVFKPSEASIDIDRPCDGCAVELVMWAWDGNARAGDQDKVLVGGNDGNYLDNGKVEGDQARLMVVRERGITGGDRAMRESSGNGSFDVNTNANPELVYSHLLKNGDLEAGEQFVVEARIEADVASRARFSTEMFLTHDKNATDGNGLDKVAPSQIGEHNGVNCLDDCVTRKVAVFHVTERIAGPVYVNITARSAVPGGGSTRVTVKRANGFVRSVRYAAAFRH